MSHIHTRALQVQQKGSVRSTGKLVFDTIVPDIEGEPKAPTPVESDVAPHVVAPEHLGMHNATLANGTMEVC